MDKSRIAVRNDQMPLTLLHLDPRRQFRGPSPGGIHDDPSIKLASIPASNPPLPEFYHRRTHMHCRTVLLRSFEQEARSAGRIENSVFGNEQATSHSLSQMRLDVFQVSPAQHLDRHSALGVEDLLTVYFLQLLIIGCDPNRSALHVLHVVGKFRPQVTPQLLRVPSQSKLRFGVVHHNDVAYSGGGRTPADGREIYHRDAQFTRGAFPCTRGAHNAGAYNYDVVGCCIHARMPLQKGSLGSSNNSAFAFTNVDPVIVG